jgi:DNA repair protein RecO (recombination protein O)
MEKSYLTKAVVIKRQDYREYDSLVVFYTLDHGKLSLITRGTKREKSKLASHIEPLSVVDLMVIRGKGRDYVGSVVARESYLNLKDNLNNLHWAFSGLSWILRLTEEGEKDDRLFNLLVNYLKALNDAPSSFTKEEGEILFAVFALRMLAIFGYEPQTKSCLSCKHNLQAKDNYFDLLSGGMLCENCFFSGKNYNREQYLKVSPEGVKFLRFIFDNNLFLGKKLKISQKIGKEISLLANHFLAFRL